MRQFNDYSSLFPPLRLQPHSGSMHVGEDHGHASGSECGCGGGCAGGGGCGCKSGSTPCRSCGSASGRSERKFGSVQYDFPDAGRFNRARLVSEGAPAGLLTDRPEAGGGDVIRFKGKAIPVPPQFSPSRWDDEQREFLGYLYGLLEDKWPDDSDGDGWAAIRTLLDAVGSAADLSATTDGLVELYPNAHMFALRDAATSAEHALNEALDRIQRRLLEHRKRDAVLDLLRRTRARDDALGVALTKSVDALAAVRDEAAEARDQLLRLAERAAEAPSLRLPNGDGGEVVVRGQLAGRLRSMAEESESVRCSIIGSGTASRALQRFLVELTKSLRSREWPPKEWPDEADGPVLMFVQLSLESVDRLSRTLETLASLRRFVALATEDTGEPTVQNAAALDGSIEARAVQAFEALRAVNNTIVRAALELRDGGISTIGARIRDLQALRVACNVQRRVAFLGLDIFDPDIVDRLRRLLDEIKRDFERRRRLREELRARIAGLLERALRRPFGTDVDALDCEGLLDRYLSELKDPATSQERLIEIYLALLRCVKRYEDYESQLEKAIEEAARARKLLEEAGEALEESDDEREVRERLEALRRLRKAIDKVLKGPCFPDRLDTMTKLYNAFSELFEEYRKSADKNAFRFTALLEMARLAYQLLGKPAPNPASTRTHLGLPYWVYWAFLPCCPKVLSPADKPADQIPPKDMWSDDRENMRKAFHPGATRCIRSQPLWDDGPRQQCCYDSWMLLVPPAAGAGTPDLRSSSLPHCLYDVIPFVEAMIGPVDDNAYCACMLFYAMTPIEIMLAGPGAVAAAAACKLAGWWPGFTAAQAGAAAAAYATDWTPDTGCDCVWDFRRGG